MPHGSGDVAFQALYVHGSKVAIDHTPDADVHAGDVVVIGGKCACAPVDIPAGTPGALAASGVFDVVKSVSTDVIASGLDIYWSAGGLAPGAHTDSENGVHMGRSVAASSSSEDTVRVRVDP